MTLQHYLPQVLWFSIFSKSVASCVDRNARVFIREQVVFFRDSGNENHYTNETIVKSFRADYQEKILGPGLDYPGSDAEPHSGLQRGFE